MGETRTIRVGTLVSGTMRSCDRLPVLMDLAETLGVDVWTIVPEDSPYNGAWGDDTMMFAAIARFEGTEYPADYVSEVINELIDAIDAALPEGYSCGSDPGDPANLGVWTHCPVCADEGGQADACEGLWYDDDPHAWARPADEFTVEVSS